MKRLFAIVLCLVLCMGIVAMTAAADGTYIIAGSKGLCGSEWNPGDSNNAMTKNGDVYTKTYANVKPGTYEFKVTDGSWNNAWPGNNYAFTVETACDVTITFNPATKDVKATGKGLAGSVKAPAINVMCIKGAGVDGLNWDIANTDLAMTKIAEGVYEYTFSNVANASFEIKFAANGNWDHYNFGGAFTESGAETDAVWNGNNIAFSVTEASNVTLKLDLSGLDYDTKNGAKFTITIAAVSGEVTPPVEEEPEVPAEPETVTVKAKAPEGWTKVMLYAWNSTGNVAAWPGSEMTLGEDGWYVAEVPAWVDHVIINNGEGAQTIDLAVEAGKNVLVVVGEQGADGKFDGTVSYEAAKTGDASPIFAVVAVMLVAGAALVTTASKKKFF